MLSISKSMVVPEIEIPWNKYLYIGDAVIKDAYSPSTHHHVGIILERDRLACQSTRQTERRSGPEQPRYCKTTRAVKFGIYSLFWSHLIPGAAGLESGRGGNSICLKLAWCISRNMCAELWESANSLTLVFNKSICIIMDCFLKWTIKLQRRIDSQPPVYSPIHV
jgi:hypothetical protein